MARVFRHRELLGSKMKNAKRVDREELVNRINRLRFFDKPILVHLRHPRYKDTVLAKAITEPSLGQKLTCRWCDEDFLGSELHRYTLLHLLVDDGWSLLVLPGILEKTNGEYFTVQIPSEGYNVTARGSRRYSCMEGIVAEVSQGGNLAEGSLMDFCRSGFRLEVPLEFSCDFEWFDPHEPVTIKLRKEQRIVFSGLCKCLRQREKLRFQEIVLVPESKHLRRFKKRNVRNPRQNLLPSPSVAFYHPFLGQTSQMEIVDISPLGFCVREQSDQGFLTPGMIIPGVTIHFAGALTVRCDVQVVYQLEEQDDIQSGFVILDMKLDDYSRLTDILTSALDPHFYSTSDFDVDALWEFLFEAGFIYPEKYDLLHRQKQKIKENYKKLFHRHPELGRHFTYRRNGQIYGHIALVRAYERAWLIEHHSSRSVHKKRPGFLVLKQIMHYLNGMYRLPSAEMDFAMAYFRPENSIPAGLFGGFARELADPQRCSVDVFSYFVLKEFPSDLTLPSGWSLERCSMSDFWELNSFYTSQSGGLLLKAMGLVEEELKNPTHPTVEELYARAGFLRRLVTYALSHTGEPHAVLVMEQSEQGLNFSELLNGIKVLVTRVEHLSWNILSAAIVRLCRFYDTSWIPVLFHPSECVHSIGAPHVREYKLWILDVRYAEEYMEYMDKKFKISFDDSPL